MHSCLMGDNIQVSWHHLALIRELGAQDVFVIFFLNSPFDRVAMAITSLEEWCTRKHVISSKKHRFIPSWCLFDSGSLINTILGSNFRCIQIHSIRFLLYFPAKVSVFYFCGDTIKPMLFLRVLGVPCVRLWLCFSSTLCFHMNLL